MAAIWPPTAKVSAQAGHEPMSPMEAIRRKCLDCSCHVAPEVRRCEAIGCPLWPFRSGHHPYTASARLRHARSEGGKRNEGEGELG